ncbi:NIPSNAP family protein [Micromonospora sp. NPDC049559]|uniref:NIPSNAP family protein n=1 Tax=Micromonospora sp. NPDC049559 TaxID=3155923 RepID=UPI00343E3D4A
MSAPASPAVVELRRYTLRPGRRDELIDLFDREFVESQERVGMTVLGQFRDLDDPDRFVWLRGFADMTSRQRALTAFYDGPVWAAHRDQANATMVDSDDVLLLRPAGPGTGVTVDPARRPPVGAPAPRRLLVATVWSFPPDAERAEVPGPGPGLVRDRLVPALGRTGPAPLAVFGTEPAVNTFPRLPVRTGENVVVTLGSYPDDETHRRHRARLADDPEVRDEILPALARVERAAPQVLRLAPTGRSLL